MMKQLAPAFSIFALAAALSVLARVWFLTQGSPLALGPVNEVTEEGLPHLFVKDLPPQISQPDDLQISQPAIYYGEAMDNEVLVQTRNQEFDFTPGIDLTGKTVQARQTNAGERK